MEDKKLKHKQTTDESSRSRSTGQQQERPRPPIERDEIVNNRTDKSDKE